MALISKTLFGKIDRVKEAVDVLKEYEPEEGYYVAFSGGKDSLVVYWLTKIAEVKCDYHYNFTTVDPPQLVKFIRTFDDVQIYHPGKENTMWNLILKHKFPPNRFMRYCCKVLKEENGNGNDKGRVKVFGIREDESRMRAGRSVVEQRTSPLGELVINPIYHWSEEDVWEFIHCNLIDYCELYDQGYPRLGCVGCPLANPRHQRRELEDFPLYKAAYIRTFDKMLELRKEAGLETTWKTGQEVYDWWVGDK